MTLTRRLAAGLPAVGVTALAALAFAGTPAGATASESAIPAVLAAPCPAGATCADDGYGGDAVGPGASADADDGRGNQGYGETPTPTPTGNANTVPPGGVSPTTAPPTGNANTVPPGGVSPTTAGVNGGVSGGTLALTGAPVATTISLGIVLVAGGGSAIWYTRRRRVV